MNSPELAHLTIISLTIDAVELRFSGKLAIRVGEDLEPKADKAAILLTEFQLN